VSGDGRVFGKRVPALSSRLRPAAEVELGYWGGPALVRGKRVLDLGCGDGRLALGVAPFAKEVTPLLANDIRPFVKEARPLARDLRPASIQLADAAPGLTRSFKQLNNFFNLLAFNPNGKEGPDNAARQEGYLFWVAWAQHMAIQLFSTSDANGVFRPVTVAAPCATIEQTIKGQPELEFLEMLTPILTESKACATK